MGVGEKNSGDVSEQVGDHGMALLHKMMNTSEEMAAYKNIVTQFNSIPKVPAVCFTQLLVWNGAA